MDMTHTSQTNPGVQPGKVSRRLSRSPANRAILVLLSLLLAILLWDVAVRLGNFPSFILPSPGLVWKRWWQVVGDGSLIRNALITLGEVLSGLALGVSVATVLGYLLARFPAVERLLSPYVVASQSIPIVAIAPLLVIWFGPGLFSKVLICALIVFFPVLVNTIVKGHNLPNPSPVGNPGCSAGVSWRAAYRSDFVGHRSSGWRVRRFGSRPGFHDQPGAWAV